MTGLRRSPMLSTPRVAFLLQEGFAGLITTSSGHPPVRIATAAPNGICLETLDLPGGPASSPPSPATGLCQAPVPARAYPGSTGSTGSAAALLCPQLPDWTLPAPHASCLHAAFTRC